MKVSQVYEYMNKIAPFGSALSWDNVGLLIGDENSEISGIIVCMDVTSEVINLKCSKSFNLIISHHPIIFTGQKSFTQDSLGYQCAVNGISVISAHTNWDMAKDGINDTLAKALNLKNIRPFLREKKTNWKKIFIHMPEENVEKIYQELTQIGCGTIGEYTGCCGVKKGEGRFISGEKSKPYIGEINQSTCVNEVTLEMVFPPYLQEAVVKTIKEYHPYETPCFDIFENEGVGTEDWIGCVGELESPMMPIAFAQVIKDATGLSPRFNDTKKPISTVGLCGGSAAQSMLEGMQKHGHKLDAYLTAEIPHHIFLEASKLGIAMYDGGHHATEMPGMIHLAHLLQEEFPDIKIEVAQVYTGEVSCIN